MKSIFATVAMFLATLFSASAADKPTIETAPYWEIAGPTNQVTWIEIHGFEKIDGVEVVHLEVLSRQKGAKPWELKHRLPHLAIMAEALKRSVLRPLKINPVYPETYEEAYRLWKKQAAAEEAVICKTSVADALSAAK